MDVLMTIDELATAVQQALTETAYHGQTSGRIRDMPAQRTIRYYTTIGLLDKPAEMRGRTAYYGRRHLMQLVAVKRLQAQGKSLVEIQAALTGAADSTLAKWAALPEGISKRAELYIGRTDPPDSSEPSEAVPEDFWAATPQARTLAAAENQKTAPGVTTALHLKVLDNVTLVIEGVDSDGLDAETLSKLQPVLERLKDVFVGKQRNEKEREQP